MFSALNFLDSGGEMGRLIRDHDWSGNPVGTSDAWPQPLRLMRWLRTEQKFEGVQSRITDYVIGLHLPSYFWLGLRGFAGALAWLLVRS